jgi:predicted alpha/beta superfamily hydrolase
MFRDYWAGRHASPPGEGELLISPPVAGPVPARSVLVYLPEGYRDGRDRYPLLLLHDGQNLFDDATSFAGSWHAERPLDALARAGRPVIAVAIPNAGAHRIHEYAPVRDKKYGGGGGEEYGRFLVEAVLPLLRRNFRIRHDRDAVGLAGASMGGLISLYARFRWPETFGLVGAMSPSLFFARESMTRWIAKQPFPGGRIYLDIGTLEGRRPRKRRSLPRFPSGAMRRLRKLRRKLEKMGYERGADLEWFEEPGGRHDEAAWSRRLRGMLEFLFPSEAG